MESDAAAHDQTYTTQAKLKQGNRNMETSLRDLEYLATLASLHSDSYTYPKYVVRCSQGISVDARNEIDEMWQDTMLTQFHDCIPGTTIRAAVDDNLEIYAKRGAQAAELIKGALHVLKADQKSGTSSETTIFEPLRLKRDQVYEHDSKLVWLSTDKHGSGKLVKSPKVTAPKAYQDGDKWILSNQRLRLTVSAGRITSLVDLAADREMIGVGPGATSAGLIIYDDYPLTYDAWDAEIYHLKCGRDIAFEDVKAEEGELRSSLTAVARFGKSSAKVTVSRQELQESKLRT